MVHLQSYLRYFGADAFWFDVSPWRLASFSLRPMFWAAIVVFFYNLLAIHGNSTSRWWYAIYVLHLLWLFTGGFWIGMPLTEYLQPSPYIDKLAMYGSFLMLGLIPLPAHLANQHIASFLEVLLPHDSISRMRKFAHVHGRAVTAACLGMCLMIPISSQGGTVRAAWAELEAQMEKSKLDVGNSMNGRLLFTDGQSVLTGYRSHHYLQIYFVNPAAGTQIKMMSVKEREHMNQMITLVGKYAEVVRLYAEMHNRLPASLDEVGFAHPLEGPLWWQNYTYSTLENGFELRSPGMDLKYNTPDDVVIKERR